MEILKTENLKKYYGEGGTCVKALDGIDFAVEKGESLYQLLELLEVESLLF